MIDDHGGDDPYRRSESRAALLDVLTRHVPGAATNAPKRNVLVVLAYLLGCLLVVGTLWPAL